ncbi:class 1a ribonucleoside-diphosphate reductase subunit alpha [Vibrio crassostreae]|uniref:class 1a ribonucleoside-diphosphate reductase subunit alpha n=1 Tax=Vibrio crassostreae TaxID=246167 RepID=UPI001B30807B|nr:class 1a ribonucleoside-diphosphate reductase subunit alpha [Vibrio crassostreae]
MLNVNVRKRNGSLEPCDFDKIHKVLFWAIEGLDNVSVSEIALKARIQFVDGMTTSDIHDILIKTAADLITEETPNYQYVAGRLSVFALRKKAFGRFTPPTLHEHVEKMVKMGLYDKALIKQYSKKEWKELDKEINHDLDLKLVHASVKQLEGKYFVQNRVTKEIYESPQIVNMMISATTFINESPSARMDFVKRHYKALATQKLSLPTPIMSGVRTKTRQFSSCVLIESGDSLDSINATASSIVRYVSQRAGIGIGAGAIRGLGSEIRGGEAFHTGCIPFYKYFQTATKCCSQGGVRGGAASVFYPMWHREYESLVVLKNNRGVEDNRVRHMDYGVQINRYLYQRLIENKDITLFSPADCEGLYEAFFADQEKFAELYERYENDPSITNKATMKAVDAFSILMQERASTGRIYIQNVDHTNDHGAFLADVAPVRQSNLCLEITLPTKPLTSVEDEDGEIALCTLAAFNLGNIESLEELEELAEIAVRALDNILSYQDYPIKAAQISTERRRALGLGVINFAYYLAKNGVKYSDGSANNLTHRTFEAIQFYSLKASMELAKERGHCPAFDETKYSKGILPIDTYKKDVDDLHSQDLLLNWEELRADILEHGLRNSTLTALMPSETSSQISNATNGIEPPRGLKSVKSSKDGILNQIVPEIETLADKYELLWDMPDNKGYIELVGLMQKFVDQSISANTSYDPLKFKSGKVPMKVLLEDLLTAYKYGVKTLYYHNTRDNAKDEQGEVTVESDDDCAGGGCKI